MRRDYRLHQLDDTEFEELVVKICLRWLGEGVISFATGKDGGRDGKFTGTAQCFPSEQNPLNGKFIIQAKHTASPVASCSEGQFSRILDDEEPRIIKLIKDGKLDHYLLFTNRTATASAEDKIVERLLGLGLKTARLIGKETIHVRLDMAPDILKSIDLPLYETPFQFLPDDLAEVVVAFHETVENGDTAFDSATDFTYVDKKEKNKINGLSEKYYKFILRDSLPYFSDLKLFLQNPRNTHLAALYHDTANELKAKLLVHGGNFSSFDEALDRMYSIIVGNNTQLKYKRRYVTVLLHYMYFDCDIGEHNC